MSITAMNIAVVSLACFICSAASMFTLLQLMLMIRGKQKSPPRVSLRPTTVSDCNHKRSTHDELFSFVDLTTIPVLTAGSRSR